MFVTCPDCNRQYRIRADQLSAAAGEVRCGFCGTQFNALARLSDKPLPAPEPVVTEEFPGPLEEQAETQIVAESLEAEPQFDIPDPEPDPQIAEIVEIDEPESTREPKLDLSYVDNVVETPVLPEVLLEEIPQQRSWVSTALWGLGTLLLIFIVLAQLAWFNRDYILREYPELLPLAKQLCEKYDCQLMRHRNISAIKLLNRDVRFHPIYADALLVNATMANRSDKIQPFPHIQLTLFDTIGQMIAFREFIPNEYLDDSILARKGMAPDQPVHFVLEVTGPTKGAVSFEFRFL